MVDAVNSNPPNFETDLDSIEAVDELIVKLDKVIMYLMLGVNNFIRSPLFIIII